MENNEYDISDDELYNSLTEGYKQSLEFYKKNLTIDMLNEKFERVSALKQVFRKILDEHSEDGSYAVIALAGAATMGLSRNLLGTLGTAGVGAFIGHLANATVIPMLMSYQEELERDRMDAAISELENG